MARKGDGRRDLIEAVVTCTGNLHDPDFQLRFHRWVSKLKTLINLKNDEKEPFIKKVEPWNSVRVTISLSTEAAQRLRHLAQEDANALRSLGILSVQVEGDQVISLTLRDQYNGERQVFLGGSSSGNGEEAGTSSSSSSSISSLSSTSSTSSATLNGPISVPHDLLSSPGSSAFRSPNVIAPSGVSIPLPPKNSVPPGGTVGVGGRTQFPFTSMIHAASAQLQRSESSTVVSSPSHSPAGVNVVASISTAVSINSTNVNSNFGGGGLVSHSITSASASVVSGGGVGTEQPKHIGMTPTTLDQFNSNANSNSQKSPSQSLLLVNVPSTPYSNSNNNTVCSTVPPPSTHASSLAFNHNNNQQQQQQQQFSKVVLTGSDGLKNPLNTNTSPLLINLLQNHDSPSPSSSSSSSSSSTPTTPPTSSSPSSAAPPGLGSGMLPPTESPNLKRYQRQRRGSSLDAPNSNQSPGGGANSEPPSPLGTSSTSNDAFQFTLPSPSQFVDPQQQQQQSNNSPTGGTKVAYTSQYQGQAQQQLITGRGTLLSPPQGFLQQNPQQGGIRAIRLQTSTGMIGQQQHLIMNGPQNPQFYQQQQQRFNMPNQQQQQQQQAGAPPTPVPIATWLQNQNMAINVNEMTGDGKSLNTYSSIMVNSTGSYQSEFIPSTIGGSTGRDNISLMPTILTGSTSSNLSFTMQSGIGVQGPGNVSKASPTSHAVLIKSMTKEQQLTSTGKPRQFLINPLTGHLEPMPSESSSDEEGDEEGGTGKGSKKKRPKPPGSIRPKGVGGGKPIHPGMSMQAAFKDQGSLPISTVPLKPAAEKIKLRLKLEKNEPTNQAYKVENVSFSKKGIGAPSSTSSSVSLPAPISALSSASPSGTTAVTSSEQPRVPPLHISLRGRNAVVVRDENKSGSSEPGSPKVQQQQKPNEPVTSPSSNQPTSQVSTAPTNPPPPSGSLTPTPNSLLVGNKRTKVRLKSTDSSTSLESEPGKKTPAKITRPRLSKDSGSAPISEELKIENPEGQGVSSKALPLANHILLPSTTPKVDGSPLQRSIRRKSDSKTPPELKSPTRENIISPTAKSFRNSEASQLLKHLSQQVESSKISPSLLAPEEGTSIQAKTAGIDAGTKVPDIPKLDQEAPKELEIAIGSTNAPLPLDQNTPKGLKSPKPLPELLALPLPTQDKSDSLSASLFANINTMSPDNTGKEPITSSPLTSSSKSLPSPSKTSSPPPPPSTLRMSPTKGMMSMPLATGSTPSSSFQAQGPSLLNKLLTEKDKGKGTETQMISKSTLTGQSASPIKVAISVAEQSSFPEPVPFTRVRAQNVQRTSKGTSTDPMPGLSTLTPSPSSRTSTESKSKEGVEEGKSATPAKESVADKEGVVIPKTAPLIPPSIQQIKDKEESRGNGGHAEDSGIDSMDALSEKNSPNQGESPVRKESDTYPEQQQQQEIKDSSQKQSTPSSASSTAPSSVSIKSCKVVDSQVPLPTEIIGIQPPLEKPNLEKSDKTGEKCNTGITSKVVHSEGSVKAPNAESSSASESESLNKLAKPIEKSTEVKDSKPLDVKLEEVKKEDLHQNEPAKTPSASKVNKPPQNQEEPEAIEAEKNPKSLNVSSSINAPPPPSTPDDSKKIPVTSASSTAPEAPPPTSLEDKVKSHLIVPKSLLQENTRRRGSKDETESRSGSIEKSKEVQGEEGGSSKQPEKKGFSLKSIESISQNLQQRQKAMKPEPLPSGKEKKESITSEKPVETTPIAPPQSQPTPKIETSIPKSIGVNRTVSSSASGPSLLRPKSSNASPNILNRIPINPNSGARLNSGVFTSLSGSQQQPTPFIYTGGLPIKVVAIPKQISPVLATSAPITITASSSQNATPAQLPGKSFSPKAGSPVQTTPLNLSSTLPNTVHLAPLSTPTTQSGGIKLIVSSPQIKVPPHLNTKPIPSPAPIAQTLVRPVNPALTPASTIEIKKGTMKPGKDSNQAIEKPGLTQNQLKTPSNPSSQGPKLSPSKLLSDSIYTNVDGIELLDTGSPGMNEEDLPFEAIIHDEKDLADVLAGEVLDEINGVDGKEEEEEGGGPFDLSSGSTVLKKGSGDSKGKAKASDLQQQQLPQEKKHLNGPSLKEPESPLLSMRSSSPLYTYSGRSGRNSTSLSNPSSIRSSTPLDDDEDGDLHGEDQEIINCLSGSDEKKVSGDDGERDESDKSMPRLDKDGEDVFEEEEENGPARKKPKLTPHTTTSSKFGEALSIEIPQGDLIPMGGSPKESKKPVRSTRSNTRLVSPDITAFRSDTPKLTKFSAKLDPSLAKNSPKPSPTGSKLSSPNPSSLRGSPIPSTANAKPANKSTGLSKRKRQESDSSSNASREENNSEEKLEIDLNTRPGKRRCSENAAELIKVCIGIEDTPKRNTALIKKMEDTAAKAAKEALLKGKRQMMTLVEESDEDLDAVDLIGRGSGRSSRSNSEDRSSSRGSSAHRNVPPKSGQNEDQKDSKYASRANHRSNATNKNEGSKKESRPRARKGGPAHEGNKSPLTPIKPRTVQGASKKENSSSASGIEKSSNPESDNQRRKTRSSVQGVHVNS